MKLTLHEKLLEEKIRFFKLINGLIACSVFGLAVYMLYLLLKVIFA